jgi:hypothetical protein
MAQPVAGVASVPAGMSACPVGPGSKAPNAPASCNDTLLAEPAAAVPVGRVGATVATVPVTPSVPSWTLVALQTQQRLGLTSSVDVLKPGQQAILTATAAATVTGTRSAIEIFDQTTGTLVGVCAQASQCLVAYTAKSGVHTFAAYVTPPVAQQPTDNVVTSNPLTVAWFDVKLTTASAPIVGPGKPVTFTAAVTADLGSTGYELGLYDKTSGARLTYCRRGTTCSTTLTKLEAGTRSIIAYVAEASESTPPPTIQAQSAPVVATWLGVTLDANTTHPQRGSSVFMRAKSNVDVTTTPWSIGIYDQQGNLVSDACKSGTTCSARISITTGSTPSFTAVIGSARPLVDDSATALVKLVHTAQAHASLIDIQVRSTPVQPTRLLWGVDSCKPLTNNPTAVGGLYGQVAHYYGKPDFWARYMTNTYNCPGISQAEIAAAAFRKMGLVPIYNDYDCNAVRTYKVGLRYATDASATAARLGIPVGTVLAIDIEPYGEQCPGAARVDAGFVEGWYDGITQAGYAPMYYGDGTAGSDFASAWCHAVADRPETAMNSYLWSFQPSLIGRWTKGRAPQFLPHEPGCAGNVAAWQYVLSTGAAPDVDSDEAISSLPLWFPQAA